MKLDAEMNEEDSKELQRCRERAYIYPMTMENVMECFTDAPQGTGRKAQLSLMTVDQALRGFSEEDIAICQINRGWLEFSVASVILWKHVIDQRVVDRLRIMGLFKIPIRNWKALLGPWCNDVRRYNGIGFEDEGLDAIAAGCVRKIVNLSGRDLKSADFQEEAESVLAWKSCKLYPVRNRMLSTEAWFYKLGKAIDAMVKMIEPTILAKVSMRSFKEWWMQRRQWCPTGSSSERHRLDIARKKDYRLTGSDRPNKQQVVETYEMKELLQHLDGKAVSIARASTKPEPGFKRRALYAGDDWSTLIASYASLDFEKHISIGGMVAKQTPQDIVEWLAADKLRSFNPKRIWLSLDYANFNKEHSKQALTMLNLRLAKLWIRASKRLVAPEPALIKAWCALWTALSHQNAYVSIDNRPKVRHFSGLWSGHRDTARDNTMLHWCYSKMMADAVYETMGLPVYTHYMGMCGDDEDGLHEDWFSMAAYIGMHSVCELHLNPVKQLADWYCHEFLQRQANKGVFPARPIAPMIATLSTGSWYKMSHTYYDTVIGSLNSNCREIIARGADPAIMRRVTAVLIGRMMTVTTDSGKVKLEWWNYRHGAEGKDSADSIWYGTGDSLPIPKFHEGRELLGRGMPSNALDDWTVSKRKWLVHVDEDGVKRYRKELKHETYKSFYGAWRQDRRDVEAIELFGIRRNEVSMSWLARMDEENQFKLNTTLKPDKWQANQLWRMIDESMAVRRPMTEEVLLNTLGLDPRLLELLGGWKGFYKHASHKERAMWQKTQEYSTEVPPSWMMLLDPALLSWWRIRKEAEE
jgi:hypothetical protein